jgi:hypothetical protein
MRVVLAASSPVRAQVGMPVLAISVGTANIYLWMLNAAFWQATAGAGGGLVSNAQMAAGL